MTKQAEFCLLGCMIGNDVATKWGLDNVEAEDFTDPMYKSLYEGIEKAAKKGRVDITTAHAEVKEEVPYAVLADMVTDTPNMESYPDYGRIVRQAGVKRRLMEMSSNGKTLEDMRPLFSAAEHSLSMSRSSKVTDPFAAMQAIREQGVSVSWGMKPLDDAFGGMYDGKVYVIGAKTSRGKTSVALNTAMDNMRRGKRVLFNIFEDPEQVWPRLTAIHKGIPLGHFTKPHMITDEDYQRAETALHETMETYKDNITVLYGATIPEMARQLERNEYDLAVLDYIQRYAHKHGLAKKGLLTHTIGAAVSDLQDLAITHRVPVLMLSQFSRRQEDMELRKPRLSDLKESGELENMTNGVVLLWWQYRDGNIRVSERVFDMVIAKNTYGPLMDVSMQIDLQTLKLEERS